MSRAGSRGPVDRILRVDPARFDPAALGPAVDWLEAGGLVIFPTDTLYGLAADPTSAAAVAALFDAKGRAREMAIPLVGGTLDDVRRVTPGWNDRMERAAGRFWPGPLSLIVDAPAGIDAAVHGGRGTVAVRVPDHPVARALAARFGGLITATSANRSGAPAVAAVADLDAIRDDPRVLVIDSGTTPGGLPSTIVDLRAAAPFLVRAGAIAWADLEQVLA